MIHTLHGGVRVEVLRAIGLMSGTSLDGVDAAIIGTDGERIESFGDEEDAPHLYIGSTDLDLYFPGLRAENGLALNHEMFACNPPVVSNTPVGSAPALIVKL